MRHDPASRRAGGFHTGGLDDAIALTDTADGDIAKVTMVNGATFYGPIAYGGQGWLAINPDMQNVWVQIQHIATIEVRNSSEFDVNYPLPRL